MRLTFVSTIAVMFWMNWQLTLLALIVVPFISPQAIISRRNIRRATKQKRSQEGAVASIVQESLQSVAVVQAFAQEDASETDFASGARQPGCKS